MCVCVCVCVFCVCVCVCVCVCFGRLVLRNGDIVLYSKSDSHWVHPTFVVFTTKLSLLKKKFQIQIIDSTSHCVCFSVHGTMYMHVLLYVCMCKSVRLSLLLCL